VPLPISFPIPLTEPSEHIVYLNAEETEEEAGTEGCELELGGLGAPSGTPVAPPGTLCVFTLLDNLGLVKNIGESSFPGFGKNDSPTGARIWVETEEGEVQIDGVWAVTAAEP
jgi:hypothetical protein